MAHGLSCSVACGNLPGPGMEPMSPALAGRFLSTVPPGKSLNFFFNNKKYFQEKSHVEAQNLSKIRSRAILV